MLQVEVAGTVIQLEDAEAALVAEVVMGTQTRNEDAYGSIVGPKQKDPQEDEAHLPRQDRSGRGEILLMG